MLIRTQQDGFIHPLSSEITEQASYANRRQLLRQWSAGAAALGTLATGAGLNKASACMTSSRRF